LVAIEIGAFYLLAIYVSVFGLNTNTYNRYIHPGRGHGPLDNSLSYMMKFMHECRDKSIDCLRLRFLGR
jgi:hypothetical protein